MTNATTSTNTPYSGVSTSSAPTAPHDYVSSLYASPQASDSGFTTKEVLLFGGGLVLTAVVTYFSTLITVNSDISNNRENISVLKSDLTHLQSDFSRAEGDIAKNEDGVSKVGVIETKVIGLEKQLDAHINSGKSDKVITN